MTDTIIAMDLLPRVSGLDPYASDQRPGTGAFARKRRQARGGDKDQGADANDAGAVSVDPGVDPLLAELDRLRAMDPSLTESGAHQALLAIRAYHQAPVELAWPVDEPWLAADAASSEPGR